MTMHTTHASEAFAASSQTRKLTLADVPIGEVRSRLTEALKKEGFAILAERDFADLVNRRLDKHYEPYVTYDVCHPKPAGETLAVSGDAELLLSRRLGVWQEGNHVVVANLPTTRPTAALDREQLDAMVHDAEARLERVFERLRATATKAKDMPPAAPVALPMLSAPELDALREAVQRQLHALLAEAAGTESHTLQHAIAVTIDLLEGVARKLTSVPAAPSQP